MHQARCLSRRTEKGRAYGVVHGEGAGGASGASVCLPHCQVRPLLPSYEKIAGAAPRAASGPLVRAERGIRGRDRKNLTSVWRGKTKHWQAIASMATEAPLRVLAGRN